MIVIVMGVAGAGKTTIGRLLAKRLGWAFLEADDYHSERNVQKMRAGIPLTDEDRQPWLEAIAARIAQARRTGEDVVLACSALRRAYREVLTGGDRSDVLTVWLSGSPDVIAPRLVERRHFMAPALLDSQLATLEPPAADEGALVLSATLPPAAAVDRIVEALAAVSDA